MIDLEGKTIIIRTEEEYDWILGNGSKQGSKWKNGDDFHKILSLPLPFKLFFEKNNKVTWGDVCHIDNVGNTYEASSIIKEDKENTQLSAAEFIDFMNKFYCEADCESCLLSYENTKCKKNLCNINNWPGNKEELIEIVKRGEITVKEKNKYEEAIDVLNAYNEAALHIPCETDFYKALKLAIEALKEMNKKEL